MAKSGTIQIKGEKQFKAKLKAIAKKSKQNSILKAGARAAATIVRRAIKKTTPVASGATKKSIISKIIGKGFRVTAIVGPDLAYKVDGHVPAFVDHLSELGFEHRDGTSVPGTYWMQRAEEACRDAAIKAFSDTVIKRIEKELSK